MALAAAVVRSALRPPARRRYGPAPSQVADVHLPAGRRAGGGAHPVAVVLHGGHWRTGFGRLVTRPLSRDLARSGIAAWNLEYRRVGSGRGGGGGWPATFDDVRAGLAALADDPRLDLSRVVLVGHSAGGHLALWAASQDGPVRPTAVVALAPVTHLRRAGAAARALVGGTVDEVPDRWAATDPMSLLPPPVPVLVVHPEGDATIDVQRSRDYVEAARTAGGDVALVTPAGEVHRDPIDPASRSWAAARAWLLERA